MTPAELKAGDKVRVIRGKHRGRIGEITSVFSHITHVQMDAPAGGSILEILRLLPTEIQKVDP